MSTETDGNNALALLQLDLGIRDLAARYCDAALMADREMYASCWARNARWYLEEHVAKRHGRPTLVEGVEAITERFVERRNQFKMYVAEVLSCVVNPLAEPRDDGVVAEAYAVIRGTSWYEDKPPGIAIARYTDLITLEDGTYKFLEKRLDTYYYGSVDLDNPPGLTPPPIDLK